ncbi:hypothetical protein [Cellulomonas sp. SLBN-39]|uniref:hypothetical protein n=1 Tax=Cellulomonas sp. SLBN-39 TaxID=2768446 RepID=UPI0011530D98|nr:hypothetical protein [Cellulomonas sp. SLBN-39]TQL01094.1 hypothetical protein FBY24_0136 [Cellulomonas sp. SLBN-39]
MARLTGELDRVLGTDFGLLTVHQNPAFGDVDSNAYASSAPGIVDVVCGGRNPTIHARLEVWDDRPPEPASLWEDCDVLPWRSLPGAGPAYVAGFDPPDGEGLDVDDLVDARVQVLAHGRHQPDEGPDATVERYLFRFWPEPMPDPLDGPPRRIAGRRPAERERTPWSGAVHGWHLAGWGVALSCIPAFDDLLRRVELHGEPFSEDTLGDGLVQPTQATAADPWERAALGEPPGRTVPAPQSETRLVAVARAARMPEIVTYRHALEALVRLGLLGQVETAQGPRMVPNPSPRRAADVLPVPEADRHRYATAPFLDHTVLAHELRALAAWSPGGALRTTVGRVAVRLSVPASDVVGALRYTAADTPSCAELPDGELTAASTFSLLAR